VCGPLYRPLKSQWSRTRVSFGSNDFSHTWQCVALLNFCQSSHVKSAIGTLAEIIDCILYTVRQISKFFHEPRCPYHGENNSPTMSCHTSSARNIRYPINTLCNDMYVADSGFPFVLSNAHSRSAMNGNIPFNGCRNSAILSSSLDSLIAQFSTVLAVNLQFCARANGGVWKKLLYIVLYII